MHVVILGRSIREGKNYEKKCGTSQHNICVHGNKEMRNGSAAKPLELQMQQLSNITDTLQYSCGAPLIPNDDDHCFKVKAMMPIKSLEMKDF